MLQGVPFVHGNRAYNLSLIHEAIAPYLEIRNEVGRWEEQHTALAIEQPKENFSEQAMQEWLEDQRHMVRSGALKIEFIA